jgi:uncharacterized protein (DUF58 family)
MDRVETILIRAKEEVYNHLNGGNLSRVLGEGYDFAELREYQSNDDIRHISWINSAKLGEPYVKKMHEERELNIAICSLVDGRFIIEDKLKLLSYVVAILGYSSYVSNDSLLPILIFGDEIKMGQPTKDIEAIEDYITNIYNLNPLGKRLNFNKLKDIKDRSLLFIIGDFLDPIDLSILSQKHEIIVVIVRNRFDENPIVDSSNQLVNPQTNQNINRVASKRAIKYYRAKLREHDRVLINHFNSYNIKYTKIYSVDEVLFKLSSII